MSANKEYFGKEKYSGKGDAILGKVKINEAADKCCFCVPIDIGVIIIAVGTILGTLGLISTVFKFLAVSITYAVGTAVIALPQLLASVYFVKFLLDRKKKEDLPDAVFLTFITTICNTIFMGIMYYASIATIIGTCVSVLISFIFVSYTYGVVKRYVSY